MIKYQLVHGLSCGLRYASIVVVDDTFNPLNLQCWMVEGGPVENDRVDALIAVGGSALLKIVLSGGAYSLQLGAANRAGGAAVSR